LTMNINDFEKLPLMGIVRGIRGEDTRPLIESVVEAGLETIEVTMNTPGARDIIRAARDVSRGRIAVGAGTVLGLDDLKAALDAGAGFIVMPVALEEVIRYCVKKGVPVFPGALSPQEVHNAWEAGAAMVKVFPCGVFGPKYIKELKGPFDRIKLMAVGGVRLENIAEYFSSGADAVAFGASVFKREWLDAGDFRSIGELVGKYVEAVKTAKKV
jgi:2-dehydro-3-deoxyphosphogluconate aldolase/(4S)-4-hydroxy-2-oxoglutarate aldolase